MTPAESIAVKVDNFYAMSKGLSTKSARKDAHNRFVAYADCYRIVTGRPMAFYQEIIQECRDIAIKVYN